MFKKRGGNIRMDMIAEILKRKQRVGDDIPTTIYNIVTEIVQYDKLSKTEKFKDLNHPLVTHGIIDKKGGFDEPIQSLYRNHSQNTPRDNLLVIS